MAKGRRSLTLGRLWGTKSMNAEQTKASREMQVFLEFLQKSELPIDRDSVENRKPPEPDILCRHNEQGFVAFEFVELCEPEIAKTVAENLKAGGVKAVSMWNADPTERIIREKLEKKYETEYPIELLCYTWERLITPDDCIIPTVQHIIELRGFGRFRRVWLLGEEACQIMYSSRDTVQNSGAELESRAPSPMSRPKRPLFPIKIPSYILWRKSGEHDIF